MNRTEQTARMLEMNRIILILQCTIMIQEAILTHCIARELPLANSTFGL